MNLWTCSFTTVSNVHLIIFKLINLCHFLCLIFTYLFILNIKSNLGLTCVLHNWYLFEDLNNNSANI